MSITLYLKTRNVFHYEVKNNAIKALSQGLMKLPQLQDDFIPCPGDLEIRPRLLNIELDLKISLVHMWLKNEGPSQGLIKLSLLP